MAEATICAAVLVSQNGRVGVVWMLLFHVSMLVATSGQLSLPFAYASLAVSAAFFYSPSPVFTPWIVPAIWWMAALSIRAIPHVLSLF